MDMDGHVIFVTENMENEIFLGIVLLMSWICAIFVIRKYKKILKI